MMRVLLVLLSVLLMAARMPAMRAVPWQVVDMPTDSTLLDIAFTDTDPNHGWAIGDKGTMLESRDGGINWRLRPLAADSQPNSDSQSGNEDYYLSSIDFEGDEGWVVGQPRVMLHTLDGGSNWDQIVLSSKLPGAPVMVTALGSEQAEMVTNVGAIYRTQDGGRTWQAGVDDAIGAVKNINRNPEDGSYLAVSSRGSFYYLYTPETGTWKPFPRDSSRRLQNMGFGPNGLAWKLNQGAEVAFTQDYLDGVWDKPIRPGLALSFGYLGAAFQNDHDFWIVGGSALLIHSPDAGKTWEKANKVSNTPANFYTIKFPDPQRGFVLGQRGTLLRYTGDA